MASLLNGLIFDALYGSRTLSSLLWTLGFTFNILHASRSSIKRPSQKLYKTINQKSLPVTATLYLATYYIHRLVIIDSGFE